jgi:hypothetical protein
MKRESKFLWVERRQRFRWAACAAILILFISAVFLCVMTPNDASSKGNSISFFNLLVDIVVGVFAIWQLYLLVTDSAKTPKLKLVGGENTHPVKGRTIKLVGENARQENRKSVRIPLWLENSEATKPGICVRVEILFYAKPFPVAHHFEKREGYEKPINFNYPNAEYFSVTLQFKDDLIVYYNSANFLGQLRVDWREEQGDPPSKLRIEYKIHSFEGSFVREELEPVQINW